MPEIITTVPPFGFTVENLSEGDALSTDRSTTSDLASPNSSSGIRSTDDDSTRCKPPQMKSGQTKKSRRSIGRRYQKRVSAKVDSPQKCAAALNLKSQIPRALLFTPTSSPASLITKVSRFLSPKPNSKANCTECKTIKSTDGQILTNVELGATQEAVDATFQNLEVVKVSNLRSSPNPFQGRNTAAILNFRIRKSVTQMDLRRTRRDNSKSFELLTASQPQSLSGLSGEASALLSNRETGIAGILGGSSQSSLVNKMFDQNNYYYVIQDRDPKVAGMRIFATIMLNAWRKRRDEVKRLMEEVNHLKRGSVKAKNQLHVFNTLFRVEQKRNNELSVQLKRSLEDINNTKSSCESLTTSLISLKADRALLEQQIQMKEQEFDGLNTILSQTKSDLFKAMAQQRELQANLSIEQRKVQTLEAQKNELINEICEINSASLLKEEILNNDIKAKDNALTEALNKLESYEWEIKELKQKTLILDNCLAVESNLRKEVSNLSHEVETLQQCLAATLGNRLRTCWNNSIAYQRATMQLVHWIAYCTLPATPAPKISAFPFGLTLEKALSIVKR
ncbi:uncharacterized protein LOC101455279 [Ceratitis capitata]|uniref:uncharacterized protein LOC101455279 n=1 Tax=Ceratitis capitata TaxID=7213 RepID=UPI000329BDE6|nr:uncharacterized protein LOC101455279 [Ceratitis capitata]